VPDDEQGAVRLDRVRRRRHHQHIAVVQHLEAGPAVDDFFLDDIDDLLARKVPDPAARARAVERLTSGEVEHGRPLTAADLRGLGIPVMPLDDRAKALMLDLLTAKNIEGVYAL